MILPDILFFLLTMILQVPNVVESLSSLYTMMETRVGVYSKLCKLQGRLDLVLSQVSNMLTTYACRHFLFLLFGAFIKLPEGIRYLKMQKWSLDWN